MTGEGAPQGWRTVRYETIDSTNEEARRRARAGDPGALWIVADEQTAGRGRRGRVWISPRGNLHASALLIGPCPQAFAPQIGFVAGVALARAARDLGAAARLKWPNDLLIDSAKCAGLLAESVQLPGGRYAVAVGIGVNCVAAPEDVGYPTATLADRAGRRLGANRLFAALSAHFAASLAVWDAGRNFAAIRADWVAHATPVGARIRVATGAGRREGTFEGLDVDGRLLFCGECGIEAIDAADLWIAPASDGLARAASPAPVAGESSS